MSNQCAKGVVVGIIGLVLGLGAALFKFVICLVGSAPCEANALAMRISTIQLSLAGGLLLAAVLMIIAAPFVPNK